jgi:hypothetical protein
MRTLAIAVIAIFGLEGCGGDPAFMREISPPQPLRSPPGAGLVVFVRPSGVAGFRHCEILDENGNFLGRSWAASHFAVAVPPGRHMFVSWGEDTDGIDIDVAPGKIYFVEVAIQPGFWSPSYQLYAITPRFSSWPKRDDWMRNTRQMTPDRDAGQAYLSGRQQDVQERLQRARKHLQEYQGSKEQDRHVIRAEEGI